MKPMPQGVVEIRRDLCPECAALSADPCAACAHGKWGSYVYCEEALPPLATMAVNAGLAVISESVAILRGEANVSNDEVARRLEICKACEHFRHSDSRCPKCGCWMTYKATLRSMHCPIKKW
jgi:hypothetical protein